VRRSNEYGTIRKIGQAFRHLLKIDLFLFFLNSNNVMAGVVAEQPVLKARGLGIESSLGRELLNRTTD